MRPRILALCLVVAVAVACGGDNGSPTATPPPTATTDPVNATALPPTIPGGAIVTPAPPSTACGQPPAVANPDLAEIEGRIAYSCDGQIWTVAPDGSDALRLTEPQQIDWQDVRLYRVPEDQPPTADEQRQYEMLMDISPRWISEDRIVFASIRDGLRLSAAADPDRPRPYVGAKELYVIDADGSNEERLTEYNLTEGSYRWEGGAGPTDFGPAVECLGVNFCFAGLLSITPTGGSEQLLAVTITEIRFSECCFFAAGLRMEDEGERVLVPGNSVFPVEANEEVRLLEWHGLGDIGLAHIVTRDGENFEHHELRFGDPDVRTLATAGPDEEFAVVYDPALSKDSGEVAYCAYRNLRGPASLLVVSTAGGEAPREVLTGLATGCSAPRWSPDGRHLVVSINNLVTVIDATTGETTPITTGITPDWGGPR
jgi:hypothetical protein